MRLLVLAATMLAAAALPALAQIAPSPAVLQDLAPTGKLRAAINFGNGVLAQRGPDGEPRGVSAELAAALANRLGVPLAYVPFEAAGKVFEALASGSVDVGFIAIEPARAAQVDFSPPYVIIEGTYLVRKKSPLKDVGDVDQPGIRIAVGLCLGLRPLSHAHAQARHAGARQGRRRGCRDSGVSRAEARRRSWRA